MVSVGRVLLLSPSAWLVLLWNGDRNVSARAHLNKCLFRSEMCERFFWGRILSRD